MPCISSASTIACISIHRYNASVEHSDDIERLREGFQIMEALIDLQDLPSGVTVEDYARMLKGLGIKRRIYPKPRKERVKRRDKFAYLDRLRSGRLVR